MTTPYRGIVRQGTVVLDMNVDLREGTAVLVTPVAEEPGSPAAVLAAVDAAPPVPATWVDDLERLIAEGRLPAAPPDPLLEEPSDEETR